MCVISSLFCYGEVSRQRLSLFRWARAVMLFEDVWLVDAVITLRLIVSYHIIEATQNTQQTYIYAQEQHTVDMIHNA